jgi:23S rRNA (guanosine2251-2'-O)-methyltransferase
VSQPKRGGLGGRAGKPGSHRKGAPKGSGGYGKDKLAGKGATPPAEERPGHPAARRAAAARRRAAEPGTDRPATGGRSGSGTTRSTRAPSGRGGSSGGGRSGGGRGGSRGRGRGDQDLVVGRNPVAEALAAGVPAETLLVAPGLDHDDRVTAALAMAKKRGLTLRETSKPELDRMTDGAVHQGVVLVAAAYEYAHPDDVLDRAVTAPEGALVVALDGVTDPRNLGAVVRSAAAFGAHGVIVPERRSAGLTSAAWKASAGAAARIPVASATNLPRTLKSCADAGLTVVGLAADGELDLDDLEVAVDPLVVVVGSEGKGLGRLVAERCDLLVRIPIAAEVESLNASVAAAVVLHEVARRRRARTA